VEKGLTGFQLKLIAVTAMLIDHIAWAFVPLETGLGQIMHFVGRITAPTMCFFIAEGYRHTRSLPRYVLRLALFALISQIPFTYYDYGRAAFFPLNVIYTLILGLLAIHCYAAIPQESMRWTAITLLILLSIPADWNMFGVLLCLGFYVLRDNWMRLAGFLVGLTLVLAAWLIAAELTAGYDFTTALRRNWFHLGILLNLLLLPRYNGLRGGGRWTRWLFYVFYPMHLAVIGLLRWRS